MSTSQKESAREASGRQQAERLPATSATRSGQARKWLNAEQAAAYLALPSRKALYEIVRQGRVPFYRFGHSLRFLPAELDEVVEAGRMRRAVYERHKKEIEVDGTSCAEQSRDYDRVDARLQQEGGK